MKEGSNFGSRLDLISNLSITCWSAAQIETSCYLAVRWPSDADFPSPGAPATSALKAGLAVAFFAEHLLGAAVAFALPTAFGARDWMPVLSLLNVFGGGVLLATGALTPNA